MGHDNILLKRTLITLSALWALVVIFFVWTLISIDPRDHSISLSALLNAAGTSVVKESIIFFIFAFGAWAIPTSIVWQVVGKFQRYPLPTTIFTTLFVYGMYLVLTAESVNIQFGNESSSGLNIQSSIDTEHKTTLWQCNNTIEVSCVDGSCQTAEDNGFTPMSVNLDESGSMSVCAYSGCWEGSAEVLYSSEFVIFVGNQLAFSTANGKDTQANIVVSVDKKDAVGTLKVDEFAQPILCK